MELTIHIPTLLYIFTILFLLIGLILSASGINKKEKDTIVVGSVWSFLGGLFLILLSMGVGA